MEAIGMFIFCGSATFGAERAGFKIDQILEMVDEMPKLNGYYFVKNRPDVPMTLPSQWENKAYLDSLKNKGLDLMYANCPCSSLSQINRNASVDGKNNVQFYRVFDGIKSVMPKAFVIENAPTLVKLGYPILLDMFDRLGDDYKFTIIRDYAGNHNVAMKRMRTLVVGWRKDVFDNKIPLLHMNKQRQLTVFDAIGDLYDKKLGEYSGHVLNENRDWKKYDHFIPHVPIDSSMLLTAIDKFDELGHIFEGDEGTIRQIKKAAEKKANGQNIWDKTAWRTLEDQAAPSLTSVSHFIHPKHDRQWTIREYARLMGFPDDFNLDNEDGECKTDTIQCLAQGVPAGFIEYITSEVREALNGNRQLLDGTEDKVTTFQHHTATKYKAFSRAELNDMTGLDSDKTFEKLEQ